MVRNRRITLAPLTLTHVAGTQLYVESGDVPQGEGYLAYWVATLPATPATTITPKVAWDDPAYRGTFVFLLAAPADAQALATAIQQSGAIPTPEATSFAWLSYDAAKGITGASLLQVGADGKVAADAAYTFGRYGFPVKAGSPVEVVRDGTGEPLRFLISYPALPSFPTPNRRVPYLPLYDEGRFCLLNEQALIADFNADIQTGWDASFRYTAYYKDQGLVTFRYPIFELAGTGSYHLLFHVQWDPLGAFPPARTELVFGGAAYILTQNQILPVASGDVVPTYFRTILDQPVGLRALTKAETPNYGRLVFDVWPSPSGPEMYMVPAGEFELGTAPQVAPRETASARRKLLGGLSGLESFDYVPRTSSTARGDLMVFTPYQPAYAPVFPLTSPNGGLTLRSVSDTLLTPTYTTSYVSVYRGARTGDAPFYQSQPDASPLFHQEGTNNDDVLAFYDAQTVILENAAAAHPAPMAVYRGVKPDPLPLEEYTRFENQILSPSRTTAITAGNTAALRMPASEDVTTTTTPQGFLADIAGTTWKRVVLARSTTSLGAVTELAFRNLGPDLRDALQANELFLVATNPAPLGTFDNTITIADWPFTIAVGQRDATNNYTNVLIFKFGTGTVRQRAMDPATWTNPVLFTNDDAAGVSAFLNAYIAETEQLARDDARYKPFLELVDSETWNGVLALRVNIKTQAFPPDIKGLLGGIDLSRFFGHHIGINVSIVKTEGGLQMANRSSLFGLINYIAKNDAPPAQSTEELVLRRQTMVETANAAPGIYSFRVLTLQVVFTNSEIVDFTSKIILTITRWFGDSVELEGYENDPVLRNSVLLFGSYENHNGVPFYTFQGTGRFRFNATSQVLAYVEIVKAQFHTLKNEETAVVAGEELVQSLFSLWGYLSFKVLPDLDTMSFGNDADDTSGFTRGLYCANIGVGMSFTLRENEQPVPEFVFDAARMAFDLSLSYARPASLFKKFPCRVTKVESSDGDRKPSDAGYLPVITPALKTVPLQAEWYGLFFALNLGSMGALAENAGFAAGILAAWSPSPNRASATVVMQIPGTGSGKTTLSLQNVLKLGISTIKLVEEPEDSGYYLLKLTNIGLFFLGKKFPSTGTAEMTLFASDSAVADSNLAWFASYFAGQKALPRS